LVIRELSITSPTLIYAFVPQILDLIWVALRDPKVIQNNLMSIVYLCLCKINIRESAADALNASFLLIQQRDSQQRRQWYRKIYDEAEKGITKINTTDSIHGSLLALRELLANTGKVH
jgi:serine/threonine-protein kinase mTOR